MGLSTLMKSKGFKTFLARLYSIGASVVVIGALFKIEHLPGASIMLSTGLLTEAVIFFFNAFETEDEAPHIPANIMQGPYYPTSQSGVNVPDQHSTGGRSSSDFSEDGSRSIALAKFDAMLEEADISPDLLINLGMGMKKLSETANQLQSIGDVSEASKDYIGTIRKADQSLGKIAKSYEETIDKVIVKTVFKYQSIAESLSVIEEGARSYQKQMDALSKQISSLNQIYKAQRHETEEYLNELAESAEDTMRYHEQIARLNRNLNELNKFYGNMLNNVKSKNFNDRSKMF